MHCSYVGFQRGEGLMVLKAGRFDGWKNPFKCFVSGLMFLTVMFLHWPKTNFLSSACGRKTIQLFFVTAVMTESSQKNGDKAKRL